jgi:hypothetical protein
MVKGIICYFIIPYPVIIGHVSSVDSAVFNFTASVWG